MGPRAEVTLTGTVLWTGGRRTVLQTDGDDDLIVIVPTSALVLPADQR